MLIIQIRLTNQSHWLIQQTPVHSSACARYKSFYPVDCTPHIAIIDPRTGSPDAPIPLFFIAERIHVWSDVLTVEEFLTNGNSPYPTSS